MEKIHWREWNDEAFAEARRLDRPILLDIMAVWCHWCHVIDNTTYADDEVAKLADELFIPIRVDTDRRPDINSRYNMGGWPTTAFLTPDGQIITGGTYIPPEPMKRLLREVATLYRESREGVRPAVFPEAGVYLREPRPEGGGPLSSDIPDYFLALAREHADRQHGGFATQPKFPMAGAVRLVLRQAYERRDAELMDIATLTLDKMAGGGLFDGLEGGFFRYATRRDWSEPHYEKLLWDNAKLLRLYVEAFQITGNDNYLDVAKKTAAYIRNTLTRPDGGFGGSQDADEEYYRLDMEGRRRRPAPRVDHPIFTNANALAASAFALLGDVTGNDDWTGAAAATLSRLLDHAQDRSGGMYHFLANGRRHQLGLLADQGHRIGALVDVYQSTANDRFLVAAGRIADYVARNLVDPQTGAFFDRLPESMAPGALAEAQTPIADNGVAASALIGLAYDAGKARYRQMAERALSAFGQSYRQHGLLAADYGTAVHQLLHPAAEVYVVGDPADPAVAALWRQARHTYHPHKAIKIGIEPEAVEVEIPAAVICIADRCLAQVKTADELDARLKTAA